MKIQEPNILNILNALIVEVLKKKIQGLFKNLLSILSKAT